MQADTERGSPRFENTDWSCVSRAADASDSQARAALDRLVRTYWKPVYFYIRRRGNPVEDAKDLAQEFFVALMDRDLLSRVERGPGKFRSFLLAVLTRFLSEQHRAATAAKRGGGRERVPFDAALAEPELAAVDDSPERAFRRSWASTVLSRALERLERSLAAEGRQVYAQLLRAQADGEASHEALAARFGLTPTDVNNYLHRARVRLRDELEAEVRHTVAGGEDLADEIRELFDASA